MSRNISRVATLLATLVLSSCAGSQCTPRTITAAAPPDAGAPAPVASTKSEAPAPEANAAEPAPSAPAAKPALSPREIYVAWLKDRLPPGGEVIDGAAD